MFSGLQVQIQPGFNNFYLDKITWLPDTANVGHWDSIINDRSGGIASLIMVV